MRDFEWIVVDDGSGDDTRNTIGKWQAAAPFPVRYFYQSNQGRAAALNRGFVAASGELVIFVDADDYFTPTAIERMLFHWDRIATAERNLFAGVAGLCAEPSGKLIGGRFPCDVMESDAVEIRTKHRVAGDKTNCYRSDLLKKNLFPVFEGEKRVPTSLLLNRLARRYKTRFVNETWVIKDRLADGLSKRIDLVRMKSPRSSRLFYQEVLLHHSHIPFDSKIRASINYVRYSMHCRTPLPEQMRDVGPPVCWFLSLPLGALLFLKDHAAIRVKRYRV